MKKIFYLVVVLFLFLFVFFKSNTWQTYKTIETKRGLEVMSYTHRLHWDRFLDYIKNIPREILKSLPIR